MNKKGFTLVELMAVMIVLGIISLISLPIVLNLQKETDNNEDVYNTVYMACETYILSNYSEYKTLDNVGGKIKVPAVILINNDYLKSTIKNPITNSKFDNKDYIEVTRNNDKTFSYKIVRE